MGKFNWQRALLLTVVIGATIGVIGYLKKEFDRLENACYTISGGVIHALGLNNVKITLFFKIVNKSDISIEISNAVFNVYVNKMFVSKVLKSNKQLLKAGGETILMVDVEFNPQDLLKVGINNIAPLLTDKDKLVIGIKGSFDAVAGMVKLKSFPFEETITLKELLTPSDTAKKC